MMTLSEFIDEEMKNPEFKKEWNLLDAEFSEMQKEIDAKAKVETKHIKAKPLKTRGKFYESSNTKA